MKSNVKVITPDGIGKQVYFENVPRKGELVIMYRQNYIVSEVTHDLNLDWSDGKSRTIIKLVKSS